MRRPSAPGYAMARTPASPASTTTKISWIAGIESCVKPSSWTAVTIAHPKKIPSSEPEQRPEHGDDDRLPPHGDPDLLRVIPTARRSPISRVRSTIDSSSVFMIPSSAMKIARNSRANTRPRIWSIWLSNCA